MRYLYWVFQANPKRTLEAVQAVLNNQYSWMWVGISTLQIEIWRQIGTELILPNSRLSEFSKCV